MPLEESRRELLTSHESALEAVRREAPAAGRVDLIEVSLRATGLRREYHFLFRAAAAIPQEIHARVELELEPGKPARPAFVAFGGNADQRPALQLKTLPPALVTLLEQSRGALGRRDPAEISLAAPESGAQPVYRLEAGRGKWTLGVDGLRRVRDVRFSLERRPLVSVALGAATAVAVVAGIVTFGSGWAFLSGLLGLALLLSGIERAARPPPTPSFEVQEFQAGLNRIGAFLLQRRYAEAKQELELAARSIPSDTPFDRAVLRIYETASAYGRQAQFAAGRARGLDPAILAEYARARSESRVEGRAVVDLLAQTPTPTCAFYALLNAGRGSGFLQAQVGIEQLIERAQALLKKPELGRSRGLEGYEIGQLAASLGLSFQIERLPEEQTLRRWLAGKGAVLAHLNIAVWRPGAEESQLRDYRHEVFVANSFPSARTGRPLYTVSDSGAGEINFYTYEELRGIVEELHLVASIP